MNQKSKNIALLVILGVLVLTSLILGFTKTSGINTMENKGIFTLQDTAAVDGISIKAKNLEIELTKTNGKWMLNDTYVAEQNIVRVLLSIAHDVQVTRKVAKTQAGEVADYIQKNGHAIEISSHGKTMLSFLASGNETKTVSYMMDPETNEPMIVNIPGYESYVAGIFEIPTNDWRDRTILSTNWRSLKELKIDYAEYPQYNLDIKFEFNFLQVEGVANLDTTKMMAYIDEFAAFQVDRFLDKGQNDKYDSLLQTPKTVTMSIDDINPKNSITIDFFPLLSDDKMMLGYIKSREQMVLFEVNRIQNLFAVKSDFEIQPENP